MTSAIERILSKVEAGTRLALECGIFPDPERERAVFERLAKKYPELEINPEEEVLIIRCARRARNARYN